MQTNNDKTEDGKLNSAHSFTEGCNVPVNPKESKCEDLEEQFTHEEYAEGFIDGQEFIKSALRKEIEKERDFHKPHNNDFEMGKVNAYSIVLDFLDSVTPPKQ